MKEPEFTIGIEEEYYLVDKDSRDLASNPHENLMNECQSVLQEKVSHEFLKPQIEIATGVCHTLEEARAELRHLRSTISGIADKYGCATIAASTHPFSYWATQTHTDKERYNNMVKDLKIVGRRLLICGMHVHVGVEDEDLRIDIFNQVSYFLPHLLALSTSSPFWHGEYTEMKSYRIAVFNELPRTGLPPQFANFNDYKSTINMLTNAGTIKDATRIWWDMRPSARFPTLEMRIADVCTELEDALCIAALFRCLCRMIYRLRIRNQKWRKYPLVFLQENRWLAQRDGIESSLIDLGKGQLIAYPELLHELLELLMQDAEHFGCTKEVQHALTILKRGTSADQQIDLFNSLSDKGLEKEDIWPKIVDHLIEQTNQSDK